MKNKKILILALILVMALGIGTAFADDYTVKTGDTLKCSLRLSGDKTSTERTPGNSHGIVYSRKNCSKCLLKVGRKKRLTRS